ncbi:MAG: hypothetical protein OXI03_06410, partial [Chloroflexota bacterium]|nr:hypothetical protein [Chloroflexota bacterium]
MTPSEILRDHIRRRLSRSGCGQRRLEKDAGLKKWALRGIMDPSRKQVPTVDRAAVIAAALGLEFYLGPPRKSE